MKKRYRQSRFNASQQDQDRINLVAAYFKMKPGAFMRRVIMDAVQKAETKFGLQVQNLST